MPRPERTDENGWPVFTFHFDRDYQDEMLARMQAQRMQMSLYMSDVYGTHITDHGRVQLPPFVHTSSQTRFFQYDYWVELGVNGRRENRVHAYHEILGAACEDLCLETSDLELEHISFTHEEMPTNSGMLKVKYTLKLTLPPEW